MNFCGKWITNANRPTAHEMCRANPGWYISRPRAGVHTVEDLQNMGMVGVYVGLDINGLCERIKRLTEPVPTNLIDVEI
jgi:hypothetical protein